MICVWELWKWKVGEFKKEKRFIMELLPITEHFLLITTSVHAIWFKIISYFRKLSKKKTAKDYILV